jgi:hypothetical protein
MFFSVQFPAFGHHSTTREKHVGNWYQPPSSTYIVVCPFFETRGGRNMKDIIKEQQYPEYICMINLTSLRRTASSNSCGLFVAPNNWIIINR